MRVVLPFAEILKLHNADLIAWKSLREWMCRVVLTPPQLGQAGSRDCESGHGPRPMLLPLFLGLKPGVSEFK